MNSQHHAPVTLPQVKSPGINSIGGKVGPRAGQDTSEERKIPTPPPGPIIQLEPGTSAVDDHYIDRIISCRHHINFTT